MPQRCKLAFDIKYAKTTKPITNKKAGGSMCLSGIVFFTVLFFTAWKLI